MKLPYNYWISLILSASVAACILFSLFGGVIVGFFTMFVNFAGGIALGGWMIMFGLGVIVMVILLIKVGTRK